MERTGIELQARRAMMVEMMGVEGYVKKSQKAP